MNEQYYIQRTSILLKGFKKKSEKLYNFSCPYCGDKRNRGYIYQNKGSWLFHCHNCALSQQFKTFLKTNNPLLFKEYQLDFFGSKKPIEKKVKLSSAKPKFLSENQPIISDKKTSTFIDISDVMSNEGYRYLINRNLDPDLFYYTENFFQFTNKIVSGTFDMKRMRKYDHPRIILPFFDKHKKLIAFQGRGLHDENPKYITIRVDEDSPKVYGLDKLDTSKDIYVLEGAFDSIMIDNAIAVLDSNYIRSGELFDVSKLIIIPDTDTRNKQIMKSVLRCIKSGMRVCLLPKKYGKDLNDLSCDGLTKKEIHDIIKKYTFHGMKLLMEFNRWKSTTI